MNTRKPNRLANYDYSSDGSYFITICVKDRQNLLWRVGATFGRPEEKNYLSECGQIIDDEINRIEEIYQSEVVIDKYAIMPNHIHFIIVLKDEVDGRLQAAPTISRIIQQFKGIVSKRIGFSIWQKLFHDHIIRNDLEYRKIWQYIDENPYKWEEDCFYNKEV